MELLKSPIFSKYKNSNAKLINFEGWEMPISFAGLIEEHKSVRNSVGLFDISHMGVISICGKNVKDHIQKLFPTNIYSIAKGQSCYSLLLNDSGGIIDDLIIYDLGVTNQEKSEIFLIVNASRYEKDFEWISDKLFKKDISIDNAKKNKALLALQGKNSFQHFEEWCQESISHIPSFGCEYKVLKNICENEKVFFSKTGYTGEKGLEILLSPNLAAKLWDFLISKNVQPCGLGARDTLRLEAGFHLYGQDLTENINPYEAGLGWVVHLENDHEFYGREYLQKISVDGNKKKFVGLEIQGKAIARKNCQIFKDDKLVGTITSGSWSPSLEKPISLGYVEYDYANIDDEVDVVIRGKKYKGIISKKNFYKKKI